MSSLLPPPSTNRTVRLRAECVAGRRAEPPTGDGPLGATRRQLEDAVAVRRWRCRRPRRDLRRVHREPHAGGEAGERDGRLRTVGGHLHDEIGLLVRDEQVGGVGHDVADFGQTGHVHLRLHAARRQLLDVGARQVGDEHVTGSVDRSDPGLVEPGERQHGGRTGARGELEHLVRLVVGAIQVSGAVYRHPSLQLRRRRQGRAEVGLRLADEAVLAPVNTSPAWSTANVKGEGDPSNWATSGPKSFCEPSESTSTIPSAPVVGDIQMAGSVHCDRTRPERQRQDRRSFRNLRQRGRRRKPRPRRAVRVQRRAARRHRRPAPRQPQRATTTDRPVRASRSVDHSFPAPPPHVGRPRRPKSGPCDPRRPGRGDMPESTVRHAPNRSGCWRRPNTSTIGLPLSGSWAWRSRAVDQSPMNRSS